jgi:hypothetical protein
MAGFIIMSVNLFSHKGRHDAARLLLEHAHTLKGQPRRTDVGPGWLRLGACNVRWSLGVPNGFPALPLPASASAQQDQQQTDGQVALLRNVIEELRRDKEELHRGLEDLRNIVTAGTPSLKARNVNSRL